MPQPFERLDKAKQDRIINAALKEFAAKGYEQASTNQIVKEAGIGKGMLFYYFSNKLGLYLYLVDYALSTFIDDFLDVIDTNEPDFIERFRITAQVKMTYYHKHFHVSNFISSVYLNEKVILPENLQNRLNEFETLAYEKIYDNIDTSLFRDGINVEKAFQLIRWSIEGYQNELISQLQNQLLPSLNLDPYWEEFYEYLNILKKTFYKEQEDEA